MNIGLNLKTSRALGGGLTYKQKIIATGPIAYWPLNELTGTAAINYGSLGAAANGVYNGTTLANTPAPDGGLAPFFNGNADFVNIYSAILAAAFTPNAAGTMAIMCKISSAGVWTNGRNAGIFRLGAAASDILTLQKSNGNYLLTSFRGTSTSKSAFNNIYNTIEWFSIMMTWNQTPDEMKGYYNTAQINSTQTPLPAYVGTLANTLSVLGGFDTTPSGTDAWDGWLAHAILWPRVISTEEMTLYNSVI